VKSKVIGLLTLFISNALTAQSIDQEFEACLAANQTTAGMTNCTNEALVKWDSELNAVYSELRTHLDENGKASLLSAQRAWIAYKELEIKNISAIYASFEGTMYIPMRAQEILEITKSRTLELQGYLSLVSFK